MKKTLKKYIHKIPENSLTKFSADECKLYVLEGLLELLFFKKPELITVTLEYATKGRFIQQKVNKSFGIRCTNGQLK